MVTSYDRLQVVLAVQVSIWTVSRSSAGVMPKRRECLEETGLFSYESGLETRQVY